eukprot:TRINITY_DN7923_c0_g1_i1.p1 TRINITY_DN7923_c0_g1~~TRINITY_DN7923_c0_g1_i1.p1  ORF type:complete len:1109 (-),score=223.60 TRINITY_DN7923_c0_g1_i1:15-3341(-)
MVTMEVDQVEEQSDANTSGNGIDEVKYSRLIYTLGKEAVEALQGSRILIFGCKGLGAEVAKNLVMSGAKFVGLVDDGAVTALDLGASFVLREENIGQNRAVCTAEQLKELNPDCIAEAIAYLNAEAHIGNYDTVVATYGTLPFLIQLNRICRENGVPMVVARARGVFGFVFADFCEQFRVKDEKGEVPYDLVVEIITQDFPATVTVIEEQRHCLEEGDEVIFHGVKGMEELNDLGPITVGSTGSHFFTILVDTRNFGCYTSGGYVSKVRASKIVSFDSLEASLVAPRFCSHDPMQEGNIRTLHIAFQAIDEFERLNHLGSSFFDSEAFNDDDLEKVLSIAKEVAIISHTVAGSDSVSMACSFADIKKDKPGSFHPSDNVEHSAGHQIYSETINREIKSRSKILSDEEAVAPGTGDRNGRRSEIDENIVKLLAAGAHVELAPLVSIIGGIAAQEAIKATTKVLMPLHQWLYFDAMECLPTLMPSFEERLNCGSRYAAQVSLFGKELQEKLGNGQWLVVGAGGVGCESMKNLVLMGVGCSPNGSIVMTDMDTVSKANLTDQVLYQVDDVGRLKAPSASRALRRINPTAQVHAHNVKFGPENEKLFDSSFFDSIYGVVSAVDTSSSRLYLDGRCVAFCKPMVDGGKHGTKGSVQVFVPHLSEMYASTRDPPEQKEIPICTLKNFPYAMEHTVRWAVELFDTLFNQRPDNVNAYLSNRDFQDVMKKSTTIEKQELLEMLRDALVKYKPLSFEACVEWARLKFEELFSNSIKQICYNFPADFKASAGTPFWSGAKRFPVAINFDPENPLHMEFIVAAANLQATVYGLKGCHDQRQFKQILKAVQVPEFQPKGGLKIAVTDSEFQVAAQQNIGSSPNARASSSSSILSELPSPATLVGYRLSSMEFDKDDTHNLHVEFVHSAANLRAQNYGIRFSDKLQARLLGGKVVPSIITTNAVVGGLMCLEIYKILQKKPLQDYRHSYFNVSLPLFTSACPLQAVQYKVMRNQKEPLTWTLWDKFEMDCVGMSLESFLQEFKQQYGLEVNMIMYGKSLLYAEFLSKKKLQERMPWTILELIHNVGKVVIPTTENKLVLSLTCADANDMDVEVPDIIIRVR